MENIILTLLNLPNIGNKTVNTILKNKIGVPKDENELLDFVLELDLKDYTKCSLIKNKINKYYEKSKYIIEQSYKNDIKLLTILDKKFPKKLRVIDNPPAILFYKGNYNALINDKSIAIIGSRKASKLGLNSAHNMGMVFAKNRYSIVSGLAKGCDEKAHIGALSENGITIAVLPSSIENIYPREHKILSKNIIDKNGCIVSEYPLGSSICKNNFIQRNRIQSGLSSCLLICETNLKSGTNHTIKYCIQQNRILSCLDLNENLKIINDLGFESYCNVITNKYDIYNLNKKILKYNSEFNEIYKSYKFIRTEQLTMDLKI